MGGTSDGNTTYYVPIQPAHFDDPLLADGPDVGRAKKRRKGGRKPPQSKKGNKDNSETHEKFDIHNVNGDSEDEEEDLSNLPSQLKDFKGKSRTLIDRTRQNFHIYLLNVNGFPSAEEVDDWSQASYKHAAMFLYGDHYEGKQYSSLLFFARRIIE